MALPRKRELMGAEEKRPGREGGDKTKRGSVKKAPEDSVSTFAAVLQ
jgi:hypothetical protein